MATTQDAKVENAKEDTAVDMAEESKGGAGGAGGGDTVRAAMESFQTSAIPPPVWVGDCWRIYGGPWSDYAALNKALADPTLNVFCYGHGRDNPDLREKCDVYRCKLVSAKQA